MGERRALVIASQCDSLNLLSFLPDAAKDVSEALLDPEVGACVPALADGRGLLVDPTMVQLDDAVTEAFERASEDEATLFIALVGHGEYDDEDFYFLTKDATLPADSRRSFLFAQRVRELLSRHSMLDGLVILLDTCHAGIAARQAGARWLRIVGEAGRRFEVLTASDDRTAADGCFSRSIAKELRGGRAELGGHLRCPDLKRLVNGACRTQRAIHLAFDGVQETDEGDQGLWLARNRSPVWRGTTAAAGNATAEIERLTRGYQPTPALGEVVAALLTGNSLVSVTGEAGSGKSTLIAALTRPSVAEGEIPPKLLHAAVFLDAGSTVESVSAELAAQLSRTVPGFAEAAARLAALGEEARTHAGALELGVLGPLAGKKIRVAFDDVHVVGAVNRAGVRAMLDDLVAAGAQVVVTANEVAGGTAVVRLGEPNQVIFGDLGVEPIPSPPPAMSANEEDEADIDWMGEEQERRVTTYRGTREGDQVIRSVLATARGKLPLGLLTAASQRLDGPSSVPAVRDALARLGPGTVGRENPGTAAEHAWIRRPWLVQLGEHDLLARLIEELAPVGGDPSSPEQVYAMANEAEHLWAARRFEDAITSLETRQSTIPVENRERWKHWAARVADERGPTDPLTLRCRARLATWTGKAGDFTAALDSFQELYPLAERELGPDNREILSIRNNIWYLTMELGGHREARRGFEALVTDATRALGANDPETFHARHMLAVAVGKCGDHGKSVDIAAAARSDAERVLGADHEMVRKLRHHLVFEGVEISTPPPSILDECRRLLDDERRMLSDDHPDVLAVAHTLALIRAKSGDRATALAEWRDLLPVSLRVLGERHEQTAKIKEQLEFWGARE
ncbi:tetratricopeptide repeat protein [Amycolatopsis minnesotensis]|uniref:Peptidase C14 caspase domain-containing protein n=1 Tax=Amycolatopsis minnesotensis TaxID=337894 RepID=A0ABP5DZW4_9PSEU